MTATDELRRMLDERGVEHFDGFDTTEWDADGIRYLANDHLRLEGRMVLRRTCTPEQAIEATLGRGTCSIRGGECDQCGAYIHRDAVLFWVPVDEGMRTVESRDVSYCPNCGRRVVAGDES